MFIASSSESSIHIMSIHKKNIQNTSKNLDKKYILIYALGQCKSSTTMRVVTRGGIITEPQRPEGLEQIMKLESHQPFQRPQIEDPITRQRPVFTQPLQNIDFIPEGQTAHFECRLIPVGDPNLKVEW